MNQLETLREPYHSRPFDESALPGEPVALLGAWLEEAINASIPEPNAMALSTVDSLGQPSSRMVLLRGLSDDGLVFFTNLTSRKAIEVADNPQVALLFYWQPMHRQVRILGQIQPCDDEVSDRYFATRPRAHQIGAWASPQSATIPDRQAIEENIRRYEKLFEGRDVPRPGFWGGYQVVPHHVEFWQGQENRLHDRFRYQRTSAGWKIERLAP